MDQCWIKQSINCPLDSPSLHQDWVNRSTSASCPLDSLSLIAPELGQSINVSTVSTRLSLFAPELGRSIVVYTGLDAYSALFLIYQLCSAESIFLSWFLTTTRHGVPQVGTLANMRHRTVVISFCRKNSCRNYTLCSVASPLLNYSYAASHYA